MTHVEFCDWVAFYLEHPFDDEHRYHRPAALVAQSMCGGEMDTKLKYLKDAAVHAESSGVAGLSGQFSEADLKTFAALGFKPQS